MKTTFIIPTFSSFYTPEDLDVPLPKVSTSSASEEFSVWKKKYEDCDASSKSNASKTQIQYDALNSQLLELKTQYIAESSAMRSEHARTIDTLKKQYISDLTTLKDEHARSIDTLKKQYDANAQTIDTLKKQYDADSTALRTEHTQTIDALKKEHTQSIDSLKRQYNADIAALREENKACSDNTIKLRDEYSSCSGRLSKMQMEYDSYRQTNESLKKKYEDIDSSASKIQDEYKSCSGRMSKMQMEYEKVQRENAELKRAIDTLKQSKSVTDQSLRSNKEEWNLALAKSNLSAYREQINRMGDSIQTISMKPTFDSRYTPRVDKVREYVGAVHRDYKDIMTSGERFKYDVNAIKDIHERIGHAISLVSNLNEDMIGAVRTYILLNKTDTDRKRNIPEVAFASDDNKLESETGSGRWIMYNTTVCKTSKPQCDPKCGLFSNVLKIEDSSNIRSYSVVKSLEAQLVAGYNIMLFGYGYSGSGKTYTLFGKPPVEGVSTTLLQNVLKQGVQVENINVYELYGTARYNGPKKYSYTVVPDLMRAKLDAREDVKIESIISSLNAGDMQPLHAMLQVITQIRQSMDHIKMTPNNPESSRGHLILEFVLDRNGVKSKYAVVDMAGVENVERIKDTFSQSTYYSKVEKGHKYLSAVQQDGYDLDKMATSVIQTYMTAFTLETLQTGIDKNTFLNSVSKRLQANGDKLADADLKKYSKDYYDYVKSYLSQILAEGAFVVQSITMLQRYFISKRTQGKEVTEIQDNTTKTIDLLKRYESTDPDHPTKFVMLALIRNVAEGIHCNSATDTIDFISKVKST